MGFSFEHTLTISEGEYVALFHGSGRKAKPLKLGALAVVGVLCLFSKWTLLIGILVLMIAAFIVFMEVKGWRFALPQSYRDSVHLHSPVTYAVSEEAFSITGDLLDVHSKWANLKVWRKTGVWLILTPHALPPLFFKVSDLERAGVFGELMELVRRNGVEFNSPEARRANPCIQRIAKRRAR